MAADTTCDIVCGVIASIVVPMLLYRALADLRPFAFIRACVT
jgi:hypothetical protein